MFATMSITPSQSRMARAALSWSTRDTAAKAQIGTNTLSRFEGGGEAYISTASALRKAFEAAGVEFVEHAAACFTGGQGVRLVAPLEATKGAPEQSGRSA